MIHAFMLVLVLGDSVAKTGAPMYWRNIEHCNYYASQIVKRYGNYIGYSSVPNKHKATAYCKPVYIDKNTPTLYDY